ncbi:MAG: DUF3244 domain-containing protein [Tannerella sp.]|jgi:hypothetical protein|nr:DUF3244 domain-containing protein [Tannerella sp.]
MGSIILNTITTWLGGTLKNENLTGSLQNTSLLLINEEGFYHNILENHWEIWLYENQTLEIEFLKELGDTEIYLKDQFGDLVYELQIFTVPSLRIIVDVEGWDPGIYSIEIKGSIEREKTSLFYDPMMYLLLFGKYPSKKMKCELTAI